MTITNEQVILFGRLFSGRQDVYGTYDPADKKRSWQVKAPVTKRVIMDHLLGRRPYGVYLLQGENVAAAAVDFDHEDTKAPAEFARRMADAGIPVYVERSKSKGYHVWIFFAPEGVKARSFRALARGVLYQIGCSDVEIFPKQDAINDPNFYGNFINTPLFGTLVDKGRTVFVDQNFIPYPDQWNFLAGVRRVTATDLDAACSRMGCLAAPAAPVVASPASSARPASGSFSFGEVTQQNQCAFRGRLYLSCGCAEPSVRPFCDPACPIQKRQDGGVSTTPGSQEIRA